MNNMFLLSLLVTAGGFDSLLPLDRRNPVRRRIALEDIIL